VLLDRVVSLAEEGLDASVRIGDLPDSSLVARQVGFVRTVICASPKYLDRAPAVRTDTLAKHAHIEFTGMKPIAKDPRFVVNTAQAAIDLAIAGRGLVRVLSYQIAPYGSRLRTVLPSLEPPPIPVHLVYLPGRIARITAAFLDHATAALRTRLLE
jgi:DNA-binding transcriptional LysR family regulator